MTDSISGVPATGTPGVEGPPAGGPETNGAASSPDAYAAAPAPPRPRIGDTRPAPTVAPRPVSRPVGAVPLADGFLEESAAPPAEADGSEDDADAASGDDETPRRSSSRRRGGRTARGRSVGRYFMCVHVQPELTQIAMLEGRALVEHYVARGSDETTQIDGNIYWGRVQNVLPGMEAAFIDIAIPKNAVLYRGDVRYDRDDVEAGSANDQPRIEDVLRPGQTILCQVTKTPIGAKGARLTQEVSLPGRFAVLVPNSSTFGISKRLGDNQRRRLRRIVDEVKPTGHGLIVRTAAEGATADELERDVASLLEQWSAIETAAARSDQPRLLYREPDLAVRLLREELNTEYRAIIIDDPTLY